MGNNQRRPVQLLDDVGHGKSLAGSGDAEKGLALIALTETGYQGSDGLGLVAGGAYSDTSLKWSMYDYLLHHSNTLSKMLLFFLNIIIIIFPILLFYVYQSLFMQNLATPIRDFLSATSYSFTNFYCTHCLTFI